MGGALTGHTGKADTALGLDWHTLRLSPESRQKSGAKGGSMPNPPSSDRGFQMQEPAHMSPSGLPGSKILPQKITKGQEKLSS